MTPLVLRRFSLAIVFVATLGCTGTPEIPKLPAGVADSGTVGPFVYRIVSTPKIAEGGYLWACVLVSQPPKPVRVRVARWVATPSPQPVGVRAMIVDGKPLLPMPSPTPPGSGVGPY